MRLQLSARAWIPIWLLFVAGCARPGIAAPKSAAAAAPPAVRKVKPLRASLAVEQDFGLVYGANVCAKEGQISGGFGCFRANGSQYHGTPRRDDGGDPAEPHVATTRVLLGLDYLLLDNWTVGLRSGLVVRGDGPKQDGSSAPQSLLFHGEARATYWFGATPFRRRGFRWGAFLAGGIAQVDTTWRVRVEEDTRRPPAVTQPLNPPVQTLDAYQKSGTGFVGGGAAMACSFDDSGSFFLELEIMQLFPSTGTTFAPTIGYEHAF